MLPDPLPLVKSADTPVVAARLLILLISVCTVSDPLTVMLCPLRTTVPPLPVSVPLTVLSVALMLAYVAPRC